MKIARDVETELRGSLMPRYPTSQAWKGERYGNQAQLEKGKVGQNSNWANRGVGMGLITGSSGSGKSTTTKPNVVPPVIAPIRNEGRVIGTKESGIFLILN